MPRLTRVKPGSDTGLQRTATASGFDYGYPDGTEPTEDELHRIEDLVIPPAWNDVWISAHPQGHIQAVGSDDAGRRQYIYHPNWATRRDRGKYARSLELAAALPRARAKVTTALQGEELSRERVLAASFRILDRSALRIGSKHHLERSGNRGLTTLQRRHAIVEDSSISLTFPKRQALTIEDTELALAIVALVEGRPRSTLLAWQNGRRRVGLSPAQINEFVGELTGGAFTAKDFRTLHGTVVAAQTLAATGESGTKRARAAAERDAVTASAEALGNTPAVARDSYIDPRVFRAYRPGLLLDISRTPESAIRSLLLD